MKGILEYFKSEISPLLRSRKNLVILGILVLTLFAGLDLLRRQQIFKSRAVADPVVFGGPNVNQRTDGTWTTSSSKVQFRITSPLGPPPPDGGLPSPSGSLRNSLLDLLAGKIVGTVYADYFNEEFACNRPTQLQIGDIDYRATCPLEPNGCRKTPRVAYRSYIDNFGDACVGSTDPSCQPDKCADCPINQPMCVDECRDPCISNPTPTPSPTPSPPPGVCTVTWSYSTASPQPNTDVTVTVTGVSGGNNWQNVGYKVDGGAFNRNLTVNPGTPPRFTFRVPAGSAGKHSISFGTDLGTRMCSPGGEFTTVGTTVCPVDSNLTISPNPAKVGDLMTFQYKAGEDLNINGDTWSGGVSPNPCKIDDNLENRRYTCTAQSSITGGVWSHYWNNKAKCGSAVYNITPACTVEWLSIPQNPSPNTDVIVKGRTGIGDFSRASFSTDNGVTWRNDFESVTGPAGGVQEATVKMKAGPAGSENRLKVATNETGTTRSICEPDAVFKSGGGTVYTTKFRVAENLIDLDEAGVVTPWQNYTKAVAENLYEYTFKEESPGLKTLFVQFMDSTGKVTSTVDCPKCQARIELLNCTVVWSDNNPQFPPANKDVILEGKQGIGDFRYSVFSVDGEPWRNDFNSVTGPEGAQTATVKINSGNPSSEHTLRVATSNGKNICTPAATFRTSGGPCTVVWSDNNPQFPPANKDVILEGKQGIGDFRYSVFSVDGEPWRNDFNSVTGPEGAQTATVKINSGNPSSEHTLRVATDNGQTVCDPVFTFKTGEILPTPTPTPTATPRVTPTPTPTPTPIAPVCTDFYPVGLSGGRTDDTGKPRYSTSDYHGGNRELTAVYSPADAVVNQPVFTKSNAGAPDLVFNKVQRNGKWQVVIPDNDSTAVDNIYTVSDSIFYGSATVQCAVAFNLVVPKKPLDTACPPDIESTQAMMHPIGNSSWTRELTVTLGASVAVAGFYNERTETPADDVILTVEGPRGAQSHTVNLTSKTGNVFYHTPDAVGTYDVVATKNGKVGPKCSGSATLTVKEAPVVTTQFRMAENLADLEETSWQNYTVEVASNPFAYSIKDNTPGVKTVFVEFMDSTGKKGGCGNNQRQPCQEQIKILGTDPAINNCSLGFEGTNAVLNLTGLNFGEKGTISSSVNNKNTDLVIRSWRNNNIQAVLENAPTGKVLPVNLVNDDGQTESGQCSSISMLSVGAKVFCRAPASYNTDNVKLVLVDEAGNKIRQTVSIDQNGVIQGLNQRLEDGKRYAVSLKAPKSLRRSFTFMAGSGMINIPKFTLPIGDIFPADGGDGAINTNDHNALVRQWSVSGNVGGRAADFNLDGRVNSIDWACMRYDFGQIDSVEPIGPLPAASSTPRPTPAPTINAGPFPTPTPTPRPSVSPSPSPSPTPSG